MSSLSEEWAAGAQAEAEARDEGLSRCLREMRDALEGVARCHPDWDEYRVLGGVTWIYSSVQPFRRRLKLAWRVLFG